MTAKTKVSIDDAKDIVQYLPFTMVQSAANTFTQLAIPTLITPEDEQIWEVQEIVLSPISSFVLTSFTFNLALALTRNSKSAFPSFLDADLIAINRLQGAGAGTPTNASAGSVEYPLNMTYTGKSIIAAPNVYAQVASAGFSAALSFEGRVYYKPVRKSKADILEILYG